MLLSLIVLNSLTVFSLQSTSFDTNLRLYDSFAEIHQPYNGPVRFRQADWDNMKQESIVLRPDQENTNSTVFFERRIVRLYENTTGKIVFVRKYGEQNGAHRCEMIRKDNEHSIVRNMATGRYFRVSSDEIEYSDEPELGVIYEVSFYPIAPNVSFIISYIVNSVRWHARYTLQTFADGRSQFQVLADIINSSPLLYHANQTQLMSGDLNLAFSNSKSSPFTAVPVSSTNSIDYSGVHQFSRVNSSLQIEPHSILTLPILLSNVRVKILFSYTLVLTIPLPVSTTDTMIISGKHKFQRLYQLSNSSSFLPTGHLLLYDSASNVLTGEWHLPTLAEFEKYEFELGQDPDIVFVYNRTLTTSQSANSSLMTTNVLIQNYKQRKVNIRFKSVCQLSMECLYYDNKARSLGSRLRYDLILEAKSEVAFTFTAVRLS